MEDLHTLLLSYDPASVSHDELLAYLDTRPEVRNWTSLYIGSALLAVPGHFLPMFYNKLLVSRFSGIRMLITPLSPSTVEGRLPKPAWDFVARPSTSGRWDSSIDLPSPPGSSGQGTLAQLLAGAPKAPPKPASYLSNVLSGFRQVEPPPATGRKSGVDLARDPGKNKK